MFKNKLEEKLHGTLAYPTLFLFVLLVLGYVCIWYAFYNFLVPVWVLTLVGAFLAYGMFTIAHEASHENISGGNVKAKNLDTVLGWLASCTLFFPFKAFAVIHLQHHAHTNDPDKDPDSYVKGNNGLEVFIRCLTLVGFYYYSSLRSNKNNVAMKKTRKQTLIFIVFIYLVAGVLISNGYGEAFLYIILLPALIAAPFLGFTFDWLPHYPHQNLGKYHNTRIVTIPGLEFLSFFQSYHLIHHLYPRIPFYNYKTKFKFIQQELLDKEAPIEGFSANDLSLFNKENTYFDIKNGQHWNYILEVATVKKETHNSIAIEFKNIGELPFKFSAGQYVVLTKYINNEKVSRCYSICSNPNEGNLIIGVKKVENGKMSTKLVNEIQAGDKLNVSGPFGNFKFKEEVVASSKTTEFKNSKKHVFVAGGSGITPMLSILKKILDDGVGGVRLVYGCKSSKDSMFNEELTLLSETYANQFELQITFKRLVKTHQEALLQNTTKNTIFYLCGPQGMMDVTKEVLKEKGVLNENIIIEEFSQINKKLEGKIHAIQQGNLRFKSYESETILQAALRNEKQLPYACKMGQCGTCKVKLLKGEVKWNDLNQKVLLENEKKEGYILTCLCTPKTALKIEK